MKIAICSTGKNLDALISLIFGRCPYFLIVDAKDAKTGEFETISNSAFESGRGAGVSAAQTIASRKVEVVICGNFGPNASSVLRTSGIKFYFAPANLSIKEVVEQYKKDKLTEVKTPTGPGFGRGQGLGGGFGQGLDQNREKQ